MEALLALCSVTVLVPAFSSFLEFTPATVLGELPDVDKPADEARVLSLDTVLVVSKASILRLPGLAATADICDFPFPAEQSTPAAS